MISDNKLPSVRFKNFDKEWEKHPLDYYLETSHERNSQGIYDREDVLSVSGDYGVVNQIEFQGRSFAGESVLNYGVVKTGDVVYTKSPLKSSPYGIIKTNRGNNGIVSVLYGVYKGKETVCTDFVQSYFCKNDRLNSYLISLISKGAKNIINVSDDDALKGDVVFPEYSEQKKISEWFIIIDELFFEKQRKLKKLILLKNTMLKKMFPKDGSSTPEIRFSGFCGDWKKVPLYSIAAKVTEKNTSMQISETFTNSAEFGVISQRDFFERDISNKENIGSYYVVREKDFVYNPRISATAPVGPINCNNLGRVGVMSPLYTVFRTHDVDSTFLEYYFKSSSWHSYMYFNGNSGARSDRFSITDDLFMNMPVMLPESGKEQEKTGRFFSALFEQINLHREELKKLSELKQAFLKKMFA